MGNRYSKNELSRVRSFVAEGWSSREIAAKLRRSEAGIRNIRYRLNLKKKMRENIRSLRQLRKELNIDIDELRQMRIRLSKDVKSLQQKREELRISNEELLKKRIENKLVELQVENPQLFYINQEEQIAILVGYFLKWFIS